MSNRALFLDRDGTLIQEKHYLHRPEEVVLEDHVIEGLLACQEKGYLLIIVTNQAGIGRGLFTEEDYHLAQDHVETLFRDQGVLFAATYFCPYHPTHGVGDYLLDSQDRKPNPGMLLKAIQDHDIDPALSYMVGDKGSDIVAGQRAGVQTVLVETGYGASEKGSIDPPPDYTGPSLNDAVFQFIL